MIPVPASARKSHSPGNEGATGGVAAAVGGIAVLATSAEAGVGRGVGTPVGVAVGGGVPGVGLTARGTAEGGTLVVGNTIFQISYVGGTGNDVVLTVLAIKTGITRTWSGAGTNDLWMNRSNWVGNVAQRGNPTGARAAPPGSGGGIPGPPSADLPADAVR